MAFWKHRYAYTTKLKIIMRSISIIPTEGRAATTEQTADVSLALSTSIANVEDVVDEPSNTEVQSSKDDSQSESSEMSCVESGGSSENEECDTSSGDSEEVNGSSDISGCDLC